MIIHSMTIRKPIHQVDLPSLIITWLLHGPWLYSPPNNNTTNFGTKFANQRLTRKDTFILVMIINIIWITQIQVTQRHQLLPFENLLQDDYHTFLLASTWAWSNKSNFSITVSRFTNHYSISMTIFETITNLNNFLLVNRFVTVKMAQQSICGKPFTTVG